MNKDNIAISVQNVSKSFKLPHEKLSSIKGLFVTMFHGKRTYERQQVLKDISFEIKKGEFFGIVGRNGSGKSTLLKLISQIYTPDKGHIQVNGKLTPFIELGVGFNPELTGRENVFLNGALLGFSREEMAAMYEEIVEFAELEKFMDQKLKNYSSGMQVRLAFSIAIRADTEILVLDEVLAVGDVNFQKKCIDYFKMLKSNKKTIILVTHDMSITEEFCDRALLLESGSIVAQGSAAVVADAYAKVNQERTDQQNESQNKKKIAAAIAGANKKVFIRKVWTQSQKGKQTAAFSANDRIFVLAEIESKTLTGPIVFTAGCKYPHGPVVFATSSKRKSLPVSITAGQKILVKWEIPNVINNGTYTLSASVLSEDLKIKHDFVEDIYQFDIQGRDWPHCLVHIDDNLEIVR